jgi:hypothetical protein
MARCHCVGLNLRWGRKGHSIVMCSGSVRNINAMRCLVHSHVTVPSPHSVKRCWMVSACHGVYTGRCERNGFCVAARCWGLWHVLICTISNWFLQTPGSSESFTIRSSSLYLAIAEQIAFLGVLFLFVRELA